MNIQANKKDATPLPITQERLSATEYNQIAASLMAILTAASVTPDAADNTQLVTAINALITAQLGDIETALQVIRGVAQ